MKTFFYLQFIWIVHWALFVYRLLILLINFFLLQTFNKSWLSNFKIKIFINCTLIILLINSFILWIRISITVERILCSCSFHLIIFILQIKKVKIIMYFWRNTLLLVEMLILIWWLITNKLIFLRKLPKYLSTFWAIFEYLTFWWKLMWPLFGDVSK